MSRLFWIAVLLFALSGCASASKKTGGAAYDAAIANTPHSTSSSTSAASSSDMWIVQAFDETPGWRPETVEDRNWGAHLAERVQHYLASRDLEAKAAEKKLTPEDLQAEMQKGLRYLCQGEIRGLHVEASQATLEVVYRLDRRFGDEMKAVQVRPIRVQQTVSGSVTTPQVESMLDEAALDIAERIVTDIPSDLVSERG